MKKLKPSSAATPSATRIRHPRPAPIRLGEPTIVSHPDGYYWQAPEDPQTFGPFETYELAVADFARFDEQRPMPGESTPEAESELGINTWIDPETKAPAEGQSPPHLEEC